MRALDLGMKDADLYLLVGDSYASGRNADKPDAPQARVGMYERAINLAPYRLDAYQRLVHALFALDAPREEDAKFLELGLGVYAGEDWLRVGLAAVEHRLKKTAAAIATLDRTLRPESTLDDQQRDYATQLRARWLYDAMGTEIEALIGEQDYSSARTVVQRYRGLIGKESELRTMLDSTEAMLEVQELIEKYEAALKARKSTQAREIGRQLLAHPALSAEMRRYVEQRLPQGGRQSDRAR